MKTAQWKEKLSSGELDEQLNDLYGHTDPSRYMALVDDFEARFGEEKDLRLFSAPGRVELCGNHTDHQRGCVVALAVDLDIIGAVAGREDGVVRLISAGTDPCYVELNGQAPKKGTSDALIYGVAKALKQQGYQVGGFDCVTASAVPFGSGLSSSAAFENFVATVFSYLYNDNRVTPVQKALAGQWAENHCFGKPCGLMDQLASCLGNVSFMDFYDSQNPISQTVDMPLKEMGRVLCVVKTGGSHADLTHHYAAIPAEMKAVAGCFGKEVLADCTKEQVMDRLPELREKVGDRAVLRALNYFDETHRSRRVLEALQQERYEDVLSALAASGTGSQCWLKNVSNPDDPDFDGVGLALYLSKAVCPGGTFRVHGGGFGGTMLGLVPTADFADYQKALEGVFGDGACIPLRVRTVGGIELKNQ